MSLVRPSAVITVDGKRYTSAEGAVVRVRTKLGLGPAHDCVDIFCWPSSKLKDASIGAKTTVALGDSGSEADVWSGEISGLRLTPDGVALEGLADTIALSRSFSSQSFIGSTIADIVNQLTSAASVNVDGVSGDTTLSSYAVDDRRSAWSHLHDLARLIGADITTTPAGALKFVAPSASSGGIGGAKGLRYGANVLDWRATTRAPAESVGVAAYGSASESGSDKWHWIRRDPDGSGSGPLNVLYALATRDGASAASDAVTARAKRATRRAQVIVVGDASLRPGQTTQIAGIPGDAGGDLRIVAVEHLLDSGSGFTSKLTVEVAA